MKSDTLAGWLERSGGDPVRVGMVLRLSRSERLAETAGRAVLARVLLCAPGVEFREAVILYRQAMACVRLATRMLAEYDLVMAATPGDVQ